VHFHYHPHSFLKTPTAAQPTGGGASNSLFQVLARRVIDRGWFPVAHRAGFHVTRPDSHWFLEQFIPFDSRTRRLRLPSTRLRSSGCLPAASATGGVRPRHGRRTIPQPTTTDAGQLPALGCPLLERGHAVQRTDRRRRAPGVSGGSKRTTGDTAFTDHDFRDLRPDVDRVRSMLRTVSREFDDVAFRYCEAIEAFRSALDLRQEPPCELDVRLRRQARRGTSSRSIPRRQRSARSMAITEDPRGNVPPRQLRYR